MSSAGEPLNLTEFQSEALKEISHMGAGWDEDFSEFYKDGISHPRTLAGAIGKTLLALGLIKRGEMELIENFSR